jgi:hypothetical protein
MPEIYSSVWLIGAPQGQPGTAKLFSAELEEVRSRTIPLIGAGPALRGIRRRV